VKGYEKRLNHWKDRSNAKDFKVDQNYLTPDEVLAGYDAVCRLYPHIPSMTTWRSWEYAAYQRYELPEPVLDIGCGDGRFFRLVWPYVKDVIGVDIDPDIVAIARQSGVYREVINSPAFEMSFPPKRFASAFANCSLEHMDHLTEVLEQIHNCLRPDAVFVLSVVTEKMVEWSTLPLLIASAGDPGRAQVLQAEYEGYHHLVNPLPVAEWADYLKKAGFQIRGYIPILPEMTGRLFLFIDHLWHVPREVGEMGDTIYPFLAGLPGFPRGFRDILSGIMHMERDLSVGSGAVFLARKF